MTIRLPAVSEESGSLDEHCQPCSGIRVRLGPHGLPLMGSGDWNDGMNRVGAGGRGESIWLAWFLVDCLRSFAEISAMRQDQSRADRYRDRADAIRAAIEENAWDGDWYIRAFFDDGTRLGSSRGQRVPDRFHRPVLGRDLGSRRCRAGPPSDAVGPGAACRSQERAVLLLTPPFDDGPLDPGYIKGYPSGIRENGAQYTHAAAWVVQAMALLGQGRLAFELYQSLNPISRARDHNHMSRYEVEPYVVAGDVYSQPPHRWPGRLDLVHRIRRLALSRGPWIDPWSSAFGRLPDTQPVHSP